MQTGFSCNKSEKLPIGSAVLLPTSLTGNEDLLAIFKGDVSICPVIFQVFLEGAFHFQMSVGRFSDLKYIPWICKKFHLVCHVRVTLLPL